MGKMNGILSAAKKSLTSIVAASMVALGGGSAVNSGCVGGMTTIKYEYGMMDDKNNTRFHGMGLEQEKGGWVVGGDITYNDKEENRIIEEELQISLLKLKVYERRQKYYVRTSFYLLRKIGSAGPKWFNFELRLGGGLTLLTTPGSTKFELEEDNIGDLPSSIQFDVKGFGQLDGIVRSNLGFDWGGYVRVGNTFKIDDDGDYTYIFSAGVDF